LTTAARGANLAGSTGSGRWAPRGVPLASLFPRYVSQSPPLFRAAGRFVRLAVAAVCLTTVPLAAQVVTGVGDDAIPLPRGGWRFLVSGLWNDHTGAYTPNANGGLTRQPLFAGLRSTAAGVAQFPTLAAAERGLRELSGDSRFAVSLGTLETNGAVRQSIAPLALDYGLTKRLSFRIVVPYAESRDASQLLLNRAGTGANVGINPAFGSTGASARSANGALLAQLDAARTALASELTRCATLTAPNCDAIRANAAGAQQLLIRSLGTRDALARVYGTATRGGAPVVPIAGSALETSVKDGITALRTDFAALGVTAISSTAAPVGASTVLGPGGGISRIATDTAFGVGYAAIGSTRRAGIGDIDLTGTWLLYDSFDADQPRRLLQPVRGVRSTLTGGWRFGTAGADRTEDAFDVPIGEGASALLLRSTTDLVWSRTLWLSATVRAAKPLADDVAVNLPFRDGAGLFAPLTVGTARRSLGLRYDVEIAPRVAIGQFFGLSGAVMLRHWGRDRYDAGNVEQSTPGLSTSALPSRSLRAASIGATFSTLASYARGRSRFPAEVIYTHTEPLGASGGLVPAVATERLELRVYTGFPRRTDAPR